MKKEHEKIMDEEFAKAKWDATSVEICRAIVNRIEALQDKPRRVLSDDAIYRLYRDDCTCVENARKYIAAEHAIQLEPVMQKLDIRVYRDEINMVRIVASGNTAVPSDWTLIDTIEKEYPA